MIPDSSYVPLYTKPELNILITLFMELKEASISFDKEITANNSTPFFFQKNLNFFNRKELSERLAIFQKLWNTKDRKTAIDMGENKC